MKKQTIWLIIGIVVSILVIGYFMGWFKNKSVTTPSSTNGTSGRANKDGRCIPYVKDNGTIGYTVYGLEATSQCQGLS